MKSVVEKLQKLLKFIINVFLFFSLEIVVPLAMLRFLFNPRYKTFLYPAIISILITLLLKAKPPFKRRVLDLYIISLIVLTAESFVVWLPSIVFVICFCIPFYVFIVFKKIERAKLLFLALGLTDSLLVLLSGTFPPGGNIFFVSICIALLNIIGMSIYVLGVKKETIFARPNIALTIFMLSVFSHSFFVYIIGGRAGWMTRFITKQKGVELILAPNKDFLMPRVIATTEGGLITYANIDQISFIRNNRLEKVWLITPFLAMVNSFICDPDNKAICYIPTRMRGIRAVNFLTEEVEVTTFKPVHYAYIIADNNMHYIAILEDIGSRHYRGDIAIARRVAPGKLERVDELELREVFPDIQCAFFLDFVDQKLRLIAKSGGKIIGLVYDVERKSLHKFMQNEDIQARRIWDASLVEDRFIFLPIDDGNLYMLDTTGKKLSEGYLLRFLRHSIYDPQRKLCYAVVDMGFLFIYDPWKAKIVRRLFLGLKTKSAYQEGNYIYIGSTAGIFRIDIDKAI